MSGRKSFNIPGHSHFLTFSCWERRQFLTDRDTNAEFLRALDRARVTEQFDIWAYVLMPEHVHLLIRPRRDEYAMAGILRRIKEQFSRDILRHWREHLPDRMADCTDRGCRPPRHRFWQPGGGFDRNLWNHDAIRHAVSYIEANPVRRGLVGEPCDWEWSSARARNGWTDFPLSIDPITCDRDTAGDSHGRPDQGAC
ncbi:MAG: transposase [Candidatus Zixiibacteriota bacterium]